MVFRNPPPAITVSKNPEHHGRMKHLDLRLYWLSDKVEHGMLNPDFIPTEEMIADCLTKCVPAPAFAENRWVCWISFLSHSLSLYLL